MIISWNLLVICDNYLYSTLKSTINRHLFLPQRILHAEATDCELNFAHKMTSQTLRRILFVVRAEKGISAKVQKCFVYIFANM